MAAAPLSAAAAAPSLVVCAFFAADSAPPFYGKLECCTVRLCVSGIMRVCVPAHGMALPATCVFVCGVVYGQQIADARMMVSKE